LKRGKSTMAFANSFSSCGRYLGREETKNKCLASAGIRERKLGKRKKKKSLGVRRFPRDAKMDKGILVPSQEKGKD